MAQRYALLSVYDKKDIVYFSKGLLKHNYTLISSGWTATTLKDAGLPVTVVSDLTGFPEMLDGRVKTLHPKIHAAILARRDKTSHMKALSDHDISPIDLVCCNLYPFEETIQKKNITEEEIIENIDIGGPTLIRSAAKNHNDVAVLTNPKNYEEVLSELDEKQHISKEMKQKLALEAFSHTAQYDSIISTYFRSRWNADSYPDNLSITMRVLQKMRYGENPHQSASFYQHLPPTQEPCITNAAQLQGKELSYNNILDSDCAIECIKEFFDPTCVIIKHATPCGIASNDNLLLTWKNAFSTDKLSPYGGIVAFNRTLTLPVAKELSNLFLEVIIAPDYSPKALELLCKKKNLRLLTLKGLDEPIKRVGAVVKSVTGGFLVQDRDTKITPPKDWKIVTKQKPTKQQLESMGFAIKCVKHVKSNSVVFVKDTETVGIGGGQTARVDATWIATHKGKENINGSILASDAFFPFRDAVDVAAKAGVEAIIQPGGSIRDEEVIKAADEAGIAMVFTGQRYFRH